MNIIVDGWTCGNCNRPLFGLPIPDSELTCPCGVAYLWVTGEWKVDNFLCLKCGEPTKPVPANGACPKCGWTFLDRSVYQA